MRGRAYFYLIHCAVLVGRGCAKLGGRWSHNLFANLINGHCSVLMSGLREPVRKNRHISHTQATFTETLLFSEGLCNAWQPVSLSVCLRFVVLNARTGDTAVYLQRAVSRFTLYSTNNDPQVKPLLGEIRGSHPVYCGYHYAVRQTRVYRTCCLYPKSKKSKIWFTPKDGS